MSPSGVRRSADHTGQYTSSSRSGDASQGQNALAQALRFHERLKVTGLVITKLDGTAKGGILLAIARQLGVPIRFVAVGEGVDDLDDFSADEFVRALVGDRAG